MWILETRRILDDVQYEFRKNRSPSDVLVRLEDEIGQAFALNKFLIAFFFFANFITTVLSRENENPF